MTLTLRAVSLNDQPLTQPITAHFDLHGGTIGRADHNTLALPDPERHISREQAEITAGGAGFLIRNVGSSNPIVVRDQSLGHGESAPLLHHDQVRIGRYLLEVIDDAANADANATTRGRGAGDEAPMARQTGAATGPLAALSPGNPFADLLGAQPQTPQQALRTTGDKPADTPWSARLPDDFDPFAPPPAPKVQAQAERPPAGAFGDLIPSAAPSSLDDLFGLRSNGGDPLAAFLGDAHPAAQGNAPRPASTDPLVLFGAAAPMPPPPEVAGDRTPELRAAFTPPRSANAAAAALRPARAEVAPVTPVAQSVAAQAVAAQDAEYTLPIAAPSAAAPVNADAAAAWAAFCEGAGVKVGVGEAGDPALMRLAGTLLRAAVDGTLRLMAVRSATRHELHAQVTMIQARNNNPLKFSPDAQAALEQLLQPPLRGFVPGPVAVTEAMDDLLGHAIGTMAGTRSALEGVLARFTPQALEQKLAGKSMIDSVLPMARKARLWELYLQHYEGIREEAQEDFHGLFGKAFLAAYEQQLEQLRRERQHS
jgi:FHA domain-containing protein